METKEQKKFYVTVNGQKVEVSEEVYRAYVRPMNASERKERREARCMVKGKRKGLVYFQAHILQPFELFIRSIMNVGIGFEIVK